MEENNQFDLNTLGRSLFYQRYSNINKLKMRSDDIKRLSDEVITDLIKNLINIDYRSEQSYTNIVCDACLLAFINNCNLNNFIQITKKD